ncbi:hypothetical protein J7L84_01535, partial [Candidatus Bipolaricaulota bacterium]|nr:hypothetical protein [Candidatus Bipolaricaulota bacterium]
AFRATMEAAREADLLLNVLDASSPRILEHLRAVERILAEEVFSPGEERPPILHVLNKVDLVRDPAQEELLAQAQAELSRHVSISARNGWNLDGLREEIARILGSRWAEVEFLIPYERSHLLRSLGDMGQLRVLGSRDGGITARLVLPREELPKLEAFRDLIVRTVD